MKIHRIKEYIPRISFVSIMCLLFFSNILFLGELINQVNFGFGRLRQDFSIYLAFIFASATIWILYGSIGKIASSLGYKTSDSKGFVITGDGNIIHLNREEEKEVERYSNTTSFGNQSYETKNPLMAFHQARGRLVAHISGLQNSSIFNLFIGIVIAFLGIVIIGTTFFEIEKYANTEKGFDASGFILFVFLPRLSIALIVQVFSFFFLLMYRSNVQDVRYFQNEITNIDYTAAAVSFLNDTGDPNTKQTITTLLKTERNRIIPKNQKLATLPNDDEIMSRLIAIDSKVSKVVRHHKEKSGEEV